MRGFLFQVHLWAGLILSIPFLLLGITGSILVFDQDVIAKMNAKPELHATAGPLGSLDAIAAAALQTAPKLRVNSITAPERAGAPVQVRLAAGGGGERRGPQAGAAPRGGERERPQAGGPPGGGERRGPPGGGGGPGGAQTLVSVDPVTFAVMRSEPAQTPMWRMMHQLHGNFLLPGLGRQLVGWAGALMLLMGLSGIVLWWPKRGQWKRAFTIRKNARGYRLNRDLHGAAGIWLWAVFIVVTFTGVYISFPQPMGAAVSAAMPGRDMRATPDAPEYDGAPVGFDAIYAAAHAQAPDARLLVLTPATRPGQPVRVTMAQPGWRPGAPSVTVFVAPGDGHVLEVRDPRQFTAGESFQAWMRALHEGIGVNIVYKILVFLSGLLPPLFVVTGTLMWLQKRNNKKAAASEG